MAYVFKKRLANRANYGSKRALGSIKYVVIHYTANDGDTDEGNSNYFANNIVKASAHYFVDGDSVTQSVPDDYIAYSVGGGKYTDCNKTGGGKLYGQCTNSNSISIELCDEVKDGVSDFSSATLDNAIALTRSLMKKYNIDINRVIRHFDVTGKQCPKPFVDNNRWKEFKSMITGSGDLTMSQYEELKNEIRQMKEKSTPMIYNYIDNNMPEWARPTIQKLVDKGVLKGDGDGLNLTEDLVRMLVINDRAGLYD